MTQIFKQIQFVLSVDKNDPRIKKLIRGSKWSITVTTKEGKKNYRLKIKSRYTLKDGSVRFIAIPIFEAN